LLETLLDQATKATHRISHNGSFEAGHNGAYGDPDTPVRNTAHWLVSLCSAHRAEPTGAYRDAAVRAMEFMISCVSNTNGAVVCRIGTGKDFSNGVLGQAHVIEALFEAYRTFGEWRAMEAALSLARRHTFSNKDACWFRVAPSGENLSPDYTFNHQLYFAACMAMLAPFDVSIAEDVKRFLIGLKRTLRLRSEGRIAHMIPPNENLLRRTRFLFRDRLSEADTIFSAKERDYHSYNLYALALLSSQGIDVAKEIESRWNSIVSYSFSKPALNVFDRRNWSTPLRSGTETRYCDYVYFCKTFSIRPPENLEVETLQYFLYSLGPSGGCELVSPDPVTQCARQYRYWRLFVLETSASPAVQPQHY